MFTVCTERRFSAVRSVPATFLLLLFMLAAAAFAQTTSGSISGTVVDPQAATVADAKVTVASTDRGVTFNAQTDATGRFVFPQVPPGVYNVTIEMSGFKKLERTGVTLVANDRLVLGVLTLDVGALTETVQVTAEATQVQADSGERSFAIQGLTLRNMGVNGRGFINLASLAPGVIFTTNNGQGGGITNFTANGVRANSNNLMIDGITDVDTGNNGGPLTAMSLDAVEEFKILTSNYQAEYGRSSGAQLSAVTRSGSRDFHGSGYLYRRQGGLNANTWINNRDGRPRTTLDQRDTGYSIGGPIFIPGKFNADRSKLFFFFNQEFQHRFTPPASPNRVRVPTALERNGDFSQTTDNSGNPFPYIRDYTLSGNCSAADTSACFRDGGVLGKIPQSRLYGTGLNILKLYPVPNYTPVGTENFNYVTEEPANQPERQEVMRIDWNAASSWRVFGRLIKNKSDVELPYGDFVLGTNLPPYFAKRSIPRYSMAFTLSGSISPTTLVEASYGNSHNQIDITPGSAQLSRTALNLQNIPTLYPDAVQLDLPPRFTYGGRVANAPNIGTNNAPFYNFNTTHDWTGSLSKIFNAHSVKAGIYWHRSLKPQSSFANANGEINFTNDTGNPFDTGFPFANAATGVFNFYEQASDYIIGRYQYVNLEWYVQDNWKVTSRLTLDYGMRFYWMPPQYDADLQASNFLESAYDRSKTPRIYRPGRNAQGARAAVDPLTGEALPEFNIGRIVPNSGSVTNGILQQENGISKYLQDDRGIMFAPRFGFALDILGNQSTVLRGGVGVFYDRAQGNTVFDTVRNPPTTFQPRLNFGRLQDIGTGNLLLAPPGLEARDVVGKIPTTYSWNFGIQQKLALDSVLDISYVGSGGRHLLRARNLNAIPYGATFQPQNQDPTRSPSATPGASALTAEFLRPYPGFADIRLLETAENSNFHSLQTSVNRRFSKGLQAGFAWTWSKALGTASDDFAFSRIDENNKRANYGRQNFDRRHNLTVNWTYELPRMTAHRAFGTVVNDWQLSGIYRYQSGAPYGVGFNIPGVNNQNLTGSYTEGARVYITGDPGAGYSSDPYRQFDVTAFAPPQPGSIGLESGRNYLNRAPINNWDLTLSKWIRLAESVRVEARLDAFNALNHTQFDGVNSTLNVTSLTNPTPTNLPFNAAGQLVNRTGFGTISSVRPPRNLQWMLRFQF